MMGLELAFVAILALSACARIPAEVLKEVPSPDGGAGGTVGIDSSGEGGQSVGGNGGNSSIAAGSAGAAPQLTELHPGYRQALCLDCHGSVAPYPHASSGFRPPDCVGCHGYNGAPHRDHAVPENSGCPDCHGTVAHVPKFVAPAHCVSCHFQR